MNSEPTVRKWYVLAAVSMGIFLGTIDGSIVNVALPVMVQELHSTFAMIEWVVLAYLLTLATLTLGVGRLGDMVGKKPLYMLGMVVFTVGSALSGQAQSAPMLVGFRVFQAIGASMITALGLGIVTEVFPPSERGRALGIAGTMVSIGIIAGPTLGGLILSVLTWNWIFYVNLPVGILGVLMVWRFVPSFRPTRGQRFDYWGAITLFVSMFSLLLALSLGQEQNNFLTVPVFALFAVWLVFLAIFVAVESRIQEPMIDLTLFKTGLFSVNLITGFLTFVCSGGLVLLLPFYLENALGYSPETAGLSLSVVPLAAGVVAPISGALSDRVGVRILTVWGLVALLVGYAFATTLTAHMSVLGYVVRLLPVGVGVGLFQSPNNSAIMGTAPRHRLGVASGLLSITRSLGQTTGVSVVGALWASLTASYILGGRESALAQTVALDHTLWGVVGLMAIALALSLWAYRQERRGGSNAGGPPAASGA